MQLIPRGMIGKEKKKETRNEKLVLSHESKASNLQMRSIAFIKQLKVVARKCTRKYGFWCSLQGLFNEP